MRAPLLLATLSAVAAVRLAAVRMGAGGLDGQHDVHVLLSNLQPAPKLAAVYALSDTDGVTTYVGASRNVALSLHAHVQTMPEKVATVRLLCFDTPDRKAMEAAKREWIRELGRIPEGNGEAAEDWADAVRSAVFAPIAPVLQQPRVAAAAMSEQPVSSPFEETTDTPAIRVTPPTQGLEFTSANVDKVLDEVRPYLISDGGNVAVVGLDEETRNVYLRLEGACGSCPSSTVTMRMGIERVLREKFSPLGEVVAVSPEEDEDEEAGGAELTVEAAKASLEQIMPAILGLGGSIEVVSAEKGTVTLRFEGPDKIKFGVELALRDNPLIQNVEFI